MALKWFKTHFCESLSFKELDEIASSVAPGSDGLTFLPYLCGSTMPKYNPDARGAFMGLTLEHTLSHAVRAILEAIACMLRSNLEYLGIKIDDERNNVRGKRQEISTDDSKVRVFVLPTNEELFIARETKRLIEK